MENIRFSSKEHKDFYCQMLIKTRNDDPYHRAFFYAIEICEETRRNIRTLFDFKNGGINPEGLSAPWQTGSTRRLCRLAFNLRNGWTEEGKENHSTPYELFDCGFAPYFFEAIRLRYSRILQKHGTLCSVSFPITTVNLLKRLSQIAEGGACVERYQDQIGHQGY